MHNQDGCTPASQVGQWYENTCARAGNTALRSVWIAFFFGRDWANGTESVDAKEKREVKDSEVTLVSFD
ncbi:hypothetical protein BDQ17DRAFT_1540214 [Cyathus striatus]|nr:hypothetical protein BDQ17DRAFT_1540214 [Cyathus striatus]